MDTGIQSTVDRTFVFVLTRRPRHRAIPVWIVTSAVVMAASAACTGAGAQPAASSARPSTAATDTSAAPTPGGTTANQASTTTRTVCFRTDLLDLTEVTGTPIAAGLEFAPLAALGGTLYGQFNTSHDSGVGSYDPRTKAFTRIASYGPNASGLIWMKAGADSVVWLAATSVTDMSQWRLALWNTRTAQLSELESSQRPEVGIPVSAPVIVGTTVVWENTAGDMTNPIVDLRARDLATGTTRLIARGQLGPPTQVGPLIVWSSAVKGPSGTTYRLQAVSATTFRPAAPPVAVQQSTMLGELTGTADELGMIADQGQGYRVYSATGRPQASLELPGAHSQTPSSDRAFQYVQLQGNHIIWQAPTAVILANLDTGVAVALPEYSAAQFVGTSVAVSWAQSPPASKVDTFTSLLAVIPWPIPDSAHC